MAKDQAVKHETYRVICETCGRTSEHEIGMPFPPVEALICHHCGASQAVQVLEKVMGRQDARMKRLQRWVLLVSVPSLIVLAIGIWLFFRAEGFMLSRGLPVFLILFSVILLAMSSTFSFTLKQRRRLLKKLADEKHLTMQAPDASDR